MAVPGAFFPSSLEVDLLKYIYWFIYSLIESWLDSSFLLPLISSNGIVEHSHLYLYIFRMFLVRLCSNMPLSYKLAIWRIENTCNCLWNCDHRRAWYVCVWLISETDYSGIQNRSVFDVVFPHLVTYSIRSLKTVLQKGGTNGHIVIYTEPSKTLSMCVIAESHPQVQPCTPVCQDQSDPDVFRGVTSTCVWGWLGADSISQRAIHPSTPPHTPSLSHDLRTCNRVV